MLVNSKLGSHLSSSSSCLHHDTNPSPLYISGPYSRTPREQSIPSYDGRFLEEGTPRHHSVSQCILSCILGGGSGIHLLWLGRKFNGRYARVTIIPKLFRSALGFTLCTRQLERKYRLGPASRRLVSVYSSMKTYSAKVTSPALGHCLRPTFQVDLGGSLAC